MSLAFDPPVRHTRKDYLGYKMDFYLFRGVTTQTIIDWYATRDADDDPEKLEPSRLCDTRPTITTRSRGTLQKGIFHFQRNSALMNYPSDNLHLLIRCKAGWALPDQFEPQRYGLAVTIQHLEEEIELYNQIQLEVRQRARVQARA